MEAADGQALEGGVKTAYDAFIRGCKSDGIWDAIKASCILAGARTLSGALVPLKGAAPTNYNFVAGDYSRTTGLKGDGLSKYLNTNRNNTADPQNNQHLAVWVTLSATGFPACPIAGRLSAGIGSTQIINTAVSTQTLSRSPDGITNDVLGTFSGFNGISRSVSSSYAARMNGANYNYTSASTTPSSTNVIVFARSNGTQSFHNGIISFYSVGESLDLAALDSRISTLMSDLAAAIP